MMGEEMLLLIVKMKFQLLWMVITFLTGVSSFLSLRRKGEQAKFIFELEHLILH